MRIAPRLSPGHRNLGGLAAPHRDAADDAELFQPCSVMPLGSGNETSPSGAGFAGFFRMAVGRWRLM